MTRHPRARAARPRAARGRSRVGERFEVEVGPVAHGGHCVARVPDGEDLRVVFVRHALPGEQVVLAITEGTDGDRFWRGDAVEVLTASPDRVTAPCVYSGPGGCGGCDFQHVELGAQRGLKAAVVAEQLRRLAGLDLTVEVEAVPGDDHGLRWRTRMQYVDLGQADDGGRRVGMRKHRSSEVVAIDDCLIAHPEAREPGPGTLSETVSATTAAGPVGPHDFTVAADGFWQVHPGAPAALVGAVLDALAPRAGESVLDLYSGVGLFARFLGEAVGADGRVASVEADRTASGHARSNLAPLLERGTGVEIVCGPVEKVLALRAQEGPDSVDLVVLDPPRTGAKRVVVEQVVSRSPRAVAYVACDPAALARDVAIFAEHGYHLTSLRAFDLFPMTHHVECVALLTKTGSDLR